MATETVLSTNITNRDATPRVINNGQNGVLKSAHGNVVCAVKDVASTYRVCQVPSNAYMVGLRLSTDGAATAGAVNVGLNYETGKESGGVIDADFFASAVALTSAAAETSILHESGVFTFANCEKPLWEAAGLTADPKCMFDIVATTSTAVTVASATLKLVAQYV